MAKRAKKKKEYKLERYIVSAIRKVWQYYPVRYKVKKAAQVGQAWKCAECKQVYEKVHVDHIDPVGNCHFANGKMNWNKYIDRMFTTEDNLRILCLPCHKIKTKEDREKNK